MMIHFAKLEDDRMSDHSRQLNKDTEIFQASKKINILKNRTIKISGMRSYNDKIDRELENG